jgi:hypothetical protein
MGDLAKKSANDKGPQLGVGMVDRDISKRRESLARWLTSSYGSITARTSSAIIAVATYTKWTH